MRNLILLLTIYVLASVGVQAQVINPDGLKEMWVNDSISNGILVSPDSTMFYHIYHNEHKKVLKLFKRDLLTNKVLLEKDFEYSGRIPDMDLSSDGKYIIMAKKANSIVIYNQQTLDSIKTIELDLADILEDKYDKEECERQRVIISFLYKPKFITNDNKFIIPGRFEPNQYWPDPSAIQGYFDCIYDLEKDEFINEFHYTRDTFPEIKNYLISPDKSQVLMCIRLNENYDYEFIRLDMEQFLDFIENENELKDYLIIAKQFIQNYRLNIEEDLLFAALYGAYTIYSLKNQNIIAKDKLKSYYSESAIINKRYITINNRENVYAVALYDFIDKKLYNIIDKKLTYENHYYIKDYNMLIFQHTNVRPPPQEFRAYQFDLESIVSVNEPKGAIDTLYPNPTQELLSLDTEKIYRNYEITDLSGIIISQGAISNAAGGTITINISELASGTYFLRLFTETSVDTYQFIKIN